MFHVKPWVVLDFFLFFRLPQFNFENLIKKGDGGLFLGFIYLSRS